MKMSKDWQEFTEACLDTPLNAVCVKTRDFTLDGPLDQCGRLIQPAIMVGEIHGEGELAELVAASGVSKVIVRGHGWLPPDEVFVWSGTIQEFNEKWRID